MGYHAILAQREVQNAMSDGEKRFTSERTLNGAPYTTEHDIGAVDLTAQILTDCMNFLGRPCQTPLHYPLRDQTLYLFAHPAPVHQRHTYGTHSRLTIISPQRLQKWFLSLAIIVARDTVGPRIFTWLVRELMASKSTRGLCTFYPPHGLPDDISESAWVNLGLHLCVHFHSVSSRWNQFSP